MKEDASIEVSAAPGCGMWLGWLVASIAGSLLGWAAGWWLSYRVPGALSTIAIGLVFGLALGAFQWLVLRVHLETAWQWIAATATGWGIGFPAGVAAAAALGLVGFQFGLLAGAITGAVCGMTQWLALRRHIKDAGWWVLASTFAWATSLLYFQPGVSWLGAFYGLLSGMVSGTVLFWLIYRPAAE